jgi:hypothetical protein
MWRDPPIKRGAIHRISSRGRDQSASSNSITGAIASSVAKARDTTVKQNRPANAGFAWTAFV